VKAGQYRRPDNIEVIDADSDLSETSLSSQEIEPTSPGGSSQAFGWGPTDEQNNDDLQGGSNCANEDNVFLIMA
jgi:hypothetical protein